MGWSEGTEGIVSVGCVIVGSCKGAVDESTPEVEAFFAMGVFDSMLKHEYILVRKYESSLRVGLSDELFEFNVAS